MLNQIKVPKLNILLSKQQHEYKKIHECISNFENMTMIERLDALNPDEIPNIPPRKAKEIGLYKQLPHKKIPRLTRK